MSIMEYLVGSFVDAALSSEKITLSDMGKRIEEDIYKIQKGKFKQPDNKLFSILSRFVDNSPFSCVMEPLEGRIIAISYSPGLTMSVMDKEKGRKLCMDYNHECRKIILMSRGKGGRKFNYYEYEL